MLRHLATCALGASLFLAFPNSALATPGVLAAVKISPAGSFNVTSSSIQGNAVGNAQKVMAKNIVVPLKTLTSSIELRDNHMKDKYLEVGKYPNAELLEASGAGGKGRGQLKIRGITKEVTGTYVVKGSELEATFPIKLSDYKIEGIRYMGAGVKDEVTLTVTVPLKPN